MKKSIKSNGVTAAGTLQTARNQMFRDASKKYREENLSSGKISLKTFVDKDTADQIKKLKVKLELPTIGDVIDVLVLAEFKRQRIS